MLKYIQLYGLIMTNERGKVLITEILDKIDNYMYYPILIIVMAIAGLYFTIFTYRKKALHAPVRLMYKMHFPP